eukprot:scaffold495_cov50-Attheya_sp.AAC.4
MLAIVRCLARPRFVPISHKHTSFLFVPSNPSSDRAPPKTNGLRRGVVCEEASVSSWASAFTLSALLFVRRSYSASATSDKAAPAAMRILEEDWFSVTVRPNCEIPRRAVSLGYTDVKTALRTAAAVDRRGLHILLFILQQID